METAGESPDQVYRKRKDKVSFTVEVDPEIAAVLEKLQAEYGARSKGRVVETLLMDLILGENS
jgi:predicted aconitase with swiveling domain